MSRPGDTVVIDACAHPMPATGDEIRRYMPAAWRDRAFPGPERYQYASPLGEYLPDLGRDGALPASDPHELERHLVDGQAIDGVVLLPLTRGLLANVDLSTVVCAATNDWLAETWLSPDTNQALVGSIRINPADPQAAVAEIERWASHGRFVQVAVPLQAHHPYGQRAYWPIWDAAAEARLPVAIHSDGGASVDFHPTPAGPVRYALEYRVLYPLNAAYHLASFIAEGVFERLPDFRVVFAEGGFSAMVPILWRLDKDWRSTRDEIPWTSRFPSDYVAQHIRFCMHRSDLPSPPADACTWLEAPQATQLLLYASNYPNRDFLAPSELPPELTERTREQLLSGNAAQLYRGNVRPASRPLQPQEAE